MFTKIKDLDREILLKIPDVKLLKVCSVSKTMWNKICDDEFIRRKLRKYPDIEKYKDRNESWKKYFLKISNYINIMKHKYNFVYSEGNPIKQYYLFKKYKGNKFIKAATDGHLSVLKFLVAKGNKIHVDNDSALEKAIENGHLEIVKYLIKLGLNYNKISSSAFCHDSLHGHYTVVKYLAEHGYNIHRDNDLALSWAASQGHIEIVKYLYEKGCRIMKKPLPGLWQIRNIV